ncbi:glycine zipper 2TM domain-containing protein, partial [Enterobacter hormaechei]
NQVQGAMQENDTYTTTQQRCKTVYDKSQKKLGYDVTNKNRHQHPKNPNQKHPPTHNTLHRKLQLKINKKNKKII